MPTYSLIIMKLFIVEHTTRSYKRVSLLNLITKTKLLVKGIHCFGHFQGSRFESKRKTRVYFCCLAFFFVNPSSSWHCIYSRRNNNNNKNNNLFHFFFLMLIFFLFCYSDNTEYFPNQHCCCLFLYVCVCDCELLQIFVSF